MGAAKKTDNALLAPKLMLRRAFLDAYPSERPLRVLNCCEGSDVIWKTLRREYACQVAGYDVKKRPGRVAIKSDRILDVAGWQYDVVDIDTYGCPLRHLFKVVDGLPMHPVTVFLTVGMTRVGGGQVSREYMAAAGLDRLRRQPPPSLMVKKTGRYMEYLAARCIHKDILLMDAREAFPQKNARYLGLRLQRKTT